ncbi:hypothetical protein RH831_05050 [Halodesulfurarchaeum sp. HSR-GB]|uniref:hypothetical protein n=1 Tax=Halodesulfurarchaeum sp. HSR-GB TaxID=3074077 RepID=UPI0028570606|nr:hypothetical protein [Halodesulfurarchaeum sp. HSR-GB]MDR5656546.1 hypothetical protein [Halodesulfurarchaeum sp. HSR-GB]
MHRAEPTVVARRYLDENLDVLETDWVTTAQTQSGNAPADLRDAIERAEREEVSRLQDPDVEQVEIELDSAPSTGQRLRLFAEEYTTGAEQFEGVIETFVTEPDQHARVVKPTDEETLEAALTAVLHEAAASGVVEEDQWEIAADGAGTSWTVQVDPQ